MAVAGTDTADAPQLESERILKLKKDTQVQNKSQASKYHEISKYRGPIYKFTFEGSNNAIYGKFEGFTLNTVVHCLGW